MRALARLLRAAIVTLLLTGLAGCASDPPSPRSVLLGNENRVFLVLPLNVATPMSPELGPLGPVIWKELERYLRAHGKELKTVSPENARELWIRSIRQVRANEKGRRAGHDDVARVLTGELRKHAEFDALIEPTLFVREATIRNRTARWDGVERQIEFEARGFAARGLANAPLEGAIPAASLHVAVFDAEGGKVHDAQGGLDLLVRVRVTVRNPSGTNDAVSVESDLGGVGSQRPLPSNFEFVTRTDLFAEREHVREGLAVAFSPFLPPMLY